MGKNKRTKHKTYGRFGLWRFLTFSVAVLVWLVAVLLMAILVYRRFGCNPSC